MNCSYLEIYNEDINDLLHPSGPASASGGSHHKQEIVIRETESGRITVTGTSCEPVTSYDGMMACLERGSATRTTGSTLMNQHSSRSHSIFSVTLEQRWPADKARGHKAEHLQSKFHLVDLAGSERAKKTGAVGKRFKESITINRGLLALGNVISALASNSQLLQLRGAGGGGVGAGAKRVHVPYRESKLTRLLQVRRGGGVGGVTIFYILRAEGRNSHLH